MNQGNIYIVFWKSFYFLSIGSCNATLWNSVERVGLPKVVLKHSPELPKALWEIVCLQTCSADGPGLPLVKVSAPTGHLSPADVRWYRGRRSARILGGWVSSLSALFAGVEVVGCSGSGGALWLCIRLCPRLAARQEVAPAFVLYRSTLVGFLRAQLFAHPLPTSISHSLRNRWPRASQHKKRDECTCTIYLIGVFLCRPWGIAGSDDPPPLPPTDTLNNKVSLCSIWPKTIFF